MKIFYKTAATATGGRSGTSTLNDGSFSVQMVRPDSDEDGVNPEQLFALGYAACFDSAMEITAKQLKLKPRYMIERLRKMADEIAQKAESVVKSMHHEGLEHPIIQKLADKIGKRSEEVMNRYFNQ